MSSRVVAIVQARMGSSRLPGKVLLPGPDGIPLLALLLRRLRQAATLDAVCVATTTLGEDDAIEELAGQEQCPVYRGSAEDVLARYAAAARWLKADLIVRVTGDCPLIDPASVDQLVRGFCGPAAPNDPFACAYHGTDRTWPEGLDVEVFTRQALERAAAQAQLPAEREHVTAWLRGHTPCFLVGCAATQYRQSGHIRVTVDTAADYAVVSAVLARLGPACTVHQLVRLYRQEPQLWAPVHDAERNPWKRELAQQRREAALTAELPEQDTPCLP